VTALLVIVKVALLLAPQSSDGRLRPQITVEPGSIPWLTNSQAPQLEEAATLTNSLVKLYREGKYTEALPLAKRVVQLREVGLTADDPLLRTALINLGQIYIALGKLKEAETAFERVAKSYETTQPDAPKFAEVLQSMALVHYAKGDWSKSEKDYQRSLEITEKAFGPDSKQTAQALFSLAEFYQFTGNYKKGESLYERLVSIQQKGTSPDQQEQLAVTVDRYACLLRKANKSAEAKGLEDRILGPTSTQDDAAALANILNGTAISLPKPSYSEEARAARAQGSVPVRVVIDETGNVLRACALSGPPQLIRESELSASRAKFSPTKINGVPVKVTGVIIYRFIKQ
jgi:tetratricopeptide (TPR) repeat protein